MDTNIILAGVGGQGILSIAYVIDNAALAAGHHFKQAEVHGMAQRGGAVQSHLRYSDRPIHSDLIPRGRADMVLSIEPLEVFRYIHFLAPDGWVVTSTTPYVNIPDYPDHDGLVAELAELPRTVLVDTGRLARAAGNIRAQNMVVVGAASNLLEFEPEAMLTHVTSLFAPKGDTIVAVNRRAFDLGRASGAFFRGLVEAGVAPLDAHRLIRKLDPDTIDPDRVGDWAAVARDRLSDVLAADGDLRADEIPATA
jgi:indolepyruvate ferredoxin oxidoreductase beta subunit